MALLVRDVCDLVFWNYLLVLIIKGVIYRARLKRLCGFGVLFFSLGNNYCLQEIGGFFSRDIKKILERSYFM